ncbi:conserved hypothetical protein [Candidatus Glomeribacter gigasporarum BEG34]|uniref:Uncharacterized protein n=1 Tax=Candidatus Glomeribacter gigasporarum BEG34 TaxID=1070319 RepID=G2JBN2_9BURK|nr:conserved hypothetical protein [Candidatus Glomeribacter gigasporarum BEG34]
MGILEKGSDLEQSQIVTNIDWSTLTSTEASAARQQITGQHLAKAARAFVDQLKRLAEEELQRLMVEAQKAADDFWAENRYQRTHGRPEEQGRFGTQIRLKHNSLQATWYRNHFIERKDGRKQPYSTHICKGIRTFHYPLRAFRRATDWEKVLIQTIEARYTLLRQRSAALTRLRAAIAQYEGLLAEGFARYTEFSRQLR